MEKSFKLYPFLLLTVIAVSATFHSCKEDVFNPEKVKATYQDKFPVKDIDPQMDWKMTTKVSVNIEVYEDAGVDYTIRVYDKNPLINQSTAKLLAEGTANNTTAFTTVMDCPSTLANVYVCRTDEHSRNVVKYVSINNNQITTTFGSSSAKTRAAWTRSVSIETYSPEKSEAEIIALLSEAEEIAPKTDYQNGMELLLPELFNKRILIWQVTTHGLCAYLMGSDIQLRLSIFRALTILRLVPIRISSIGHEIVTHIKIGT